MRATTANEPFVGIYCSRSTSDSRIKPVSVQSATRQLSALHFEPHSVEGSLQQMNRAVVGVDDEFAVRPFGVFVSADQKFQGEMFEHEIVGGFEFIVGKWTEDGAAFSDVLDEEFVGEVGEQRFHGGSLQGVNVFNILGTQKMLV
jgi:hypothetical protein